MMSDSYATVQVQGVVSRVQLPVDAGGRKVTHVYVRLGSPAFMVRVSIKGVHLDDIAVGTAVELTGRITGGSKFSKDMCIVFVEPFPDRLKIGGSLL